MDSEDFKSYLAKVALVGAAYYGSAKLGLSLAFQSGSVTAVWPPTGIALAAVVLWGNRMWPGVALGAFLANSWTGVPIYACWASRWATRSRRSSGPSCCSGWPISGRRSSAFATCSRWSAWRLP